MIVRATSTALKGVEWVNMVMDGTLPNVTIHENKDGTIDVDGDVLIYEMNFFGFPFDFNIINGDFYCFQNKITSLLGCPKIVHGSMVIHSNKLCSLKNCPRVVDEYFNISKNPLTNVDDIFRMKKCGHLILDDEQMNLRKIKIFKRMQRL